MYGLTCGRPHTITPPFWCRWQAKCNPSPFFPLPFWNGTHRISSRYILSSFSVIRYFLDDLHSSIISLLSAFYLEPHPSPPTPAGREKLDFFSFFDSISLMFFDIAISTTPITYLFLKIIKSIHYV